MISYDFSYEQSYENNRWSYDLWKFQVDMYGTAVL